VDDFLQSIVDALAANFEANGEPAHRVESLELKRARDRKGNKVYRQRHPFAVRARVVRRRKRHPDEAVVMEADIALQFKSQKGLCWWCGQPVGDDYEVDHIIPITKDGENTPRNLVIAHGLCNRKKGNKMPWEYIGRLF
jgi:5-methylcytosine-specific restriction endonuclease McrA